MTPICRQVVIDFGDVGVELRRQRRGEREALEVVAVADGIRVGRRILLKELHHCRIGTGTLRTGAQGGAIRIHGGKICRSKSVRARGGTRGILRALIGD